MNCDKCDGTGSRDVIEGLATPACRKCHGTGTLPDEHPMIATFKHYSRDDLIENACKMWDENERLRHELDLAKGDVR